MSRSYRIQVSKEISRVVHIEDGVVAPLELLSILPCEQMAQLLEAQLKEEGYEIEDGIARRELEDDIVIEVNIPEGEVALKVQGEKKMKADVKVDVWADTDYGPQKQQEQAALQREEGRVQKSMDKAEESLKREATKRLEGQLRDLRLQLNHTVGEVTKAALKIKAKSMGSVEEMAEGQDGSMEIKVRL